MAETVELSVVVPLLNEAENIAPLLDAIKVALAGISHEIICVDDGSTDGTAAIVGKACDKRILLIELPRNLGQSVALAAGIRAAEGRYIATMDGDLQNDPTDIPPMLAQLKRENLHLLVGWRKERQDEFWRRRLPSLIANWLIRRVTGVHIHDHGCTLKVFDAPLAKSLPIRGGRHRFIPQLAHLHGARVGECVVRHRARRFGVSKYGLGRTIYVLRDLVSIWFLLKTSRNSDCHVKDGVMPRFESLKL